MEDKINSDYSHIHKNNLEILEDITGKRLNKIKVHIVEPEINVLFMKLDTDWYGICGAIGSEILEIKKFDKSNHVETKPFEPFRIFINQTIHSCRILGSPWNGYGFELSFNKIRENTMIVQSVYVGEKPEEFEDCIRLGIGHYYYSNKDTWE
ncbi:hypothetical protein MO973_01865 [Paenibacillus sp. TRM 82003]|nr:hypothetical protein [Paenibacillus sp. TRM 82003]